jgi:LuxR family quorum-sensing system transcriptional regulator SolR
MGSPVKSDSVELDTVLRDWSRALQEQSVHAIAVLGPDPFGSRDDRDVVAVHPAPMAAAARALAASSDFGSGWRDSDAPLVAWQSLARGDGGGAGEWRSMWSSHGFQSLVRVEFPLPAERSFECFMFSPRELTGRNDAAPLVWSALNVWPLVRRCIAAERSKLSPRERECLVLAFQGLTARESSVQMQCAERTVNYHLANAMAKLKVDSKLAAIQRACWVGAI